MVICIVAFLTTNYTNILDIYGGGGKLLGGTYLIAFWVGMLYSAAGCYSGQDDKNTYLEWDIIHQELLL